MDDIYFVYVERQYLNLASINDSDEQLFNAPHVSCTIRKPIGIEIMRPDNQGRALHSVFIKRLSADEFVYLYIYSDLVIHMQLYEGLHAMGSGLGPDKNLCRTYSKACAAYFDYFADIADFHEV